MKTIIPSIFLLFFITSFANGQNLYLKTFGNPQQEAIIFLHGGPGYNSQNFEVTTADNLANEGYFVIVYDRRGEGRSNVLKAEYTFQETIADIDSIYKQYNITKATLIGHSFGGVVGTYYAEVHPEKIHSLILVSTPLSLPETFKTIIERSEAIYKEKGDNVNLNYLLMLKNMDKGSLEYSSYCFMHALHNSSSFYLPKEMTDEAKDLYSKLKVNPIVENTAYQAVQGFWKNERYTTLDISEKIQKLLNQKVQVYALYGKEDGLYSVGQLSDLQKMIPSAHFKYLDNCSHNVFIDQQELFCKYISEWMGK